MKKQNHKVRLLYSFFLCMVSLPGFTVEKPETTVQWKCWQHTLKSHKNSEFQAVNLKMVFTSKDDKTFQVPAFSEDGKTFHFRAAFPSPGTWTWKTTCTDVSNTELHNREGLVKVKTYKGNNPLYRHGDLMVSNNKRYLAHSDGTPFLWMGDTGWNVALKSTTKEWEYYVDTRAVQGFSVIQIAATGYSKKYPSLAKEARSFTGEGKPDSVFWPDLENKISYANSKGLAVFMVGVGARFKELFIQNPGNMDFATYITARFAGHMVIFSPSFDEMYDENNKKVAEELKMLTRHLVTQHPGTHYPSNLKYRNDGMLDFCGLQSGHHNGNLSEAYKAARSWTLDMWNGEPVKPVINIEAMYDGYGDLNGPNWRAKDSRKLGWISWLSGSRGYTYGAGDMPPKVPEGKGGIWDFNNDPASNDNWRKAIFWPSARQMTIMHNFFKAIPWWHLEPAHELIKNQVENETAKMVVSRSKDGNFLLAYLPDNAQIKLDLSNYSKKMKGKWFNPITAKYSSIDKPIIRGSEVTFLRPAGWEDAVLWITKF